MNQLILPAPLWRRLTSALYDGLLLLSIWMVLMLFLVIGGSYVGAPAPPHVVRAVLVTAGLIFFVRSWTHGGQTLGMRAWRLVVRRSDGTPLSLTRATLRYLLAWVSWLAFGLGVLWCLVDAQRRSWHDVLTGTEVVVLPKPAG
ncbi:RDD family protein [Algiphilus sp. W345]|uniref:RDD family protein n=1 Tax=Banduia mediterranea TaxID=3075609 RepID=A0ABU2WKM9_9GAMM|nr:RDD family protein [Algiphilus sp. W345]MDT0498438.1 RDD family protein [Algiphilus sp. W345]